MLLLIIMISLSRASTWSKVLDKVRNRLSSWKSKLLSRAGRLVLLKSVLNNLPLYYMSIFKIPIKVVKQIVSLQRKFFWVGNQSNRGLPLVKWEMLERPRHLGGLGIGNLVLKNHALLFKWWWKFSLDNGSLWKRAICSIHRLDPNIPIHNQVSAGCPGGVWNSVMSVAKDDEKLHDIFLKGCWMMVGNGLNTKFWIHKWIGEKPLKECFPRLFQISLQQQETIANMGFWDGTEWHWNLTWRRVLFQWEIETLGDLWKTLEAADLSKEGQDKWQWKFDSSGSFSIKSFSGEVWKQSSITNNVKDVWKGVSPPRVELLVWFVLLGKLNTKDKLLRLNLIQQNDACCPFCNLELESVNHLFLHCVFAWKVWSGCLQWWGVEIPMAQNTGQWFDIWMAAMRGSFKAKVWASVFFSVIWTLWCQRNKIVFENAQTDWEFMLYTVKLRVGYWIKGWNQNFPYNPGAVENNLQAVLSWRGHNWNQ